MSEKETGLRVDDDEPFGPARTPEETASTASKDLDDAFDLYQKQDPTEIDTDEEKRVRRKLDLHLMPLLCVSYMLQYLDKVSISAASVYGLQKGTHLVGQDYAWLSRSCQLLMKVSFIRLTGFTFKRHCFILDIWWHSIPLDTCCRDFRQGNSSADLQ
jgi:hypothetical protein